MKTWPLVLVLSAVFTLPVLADEEPQITGFESLKYRNIGPTRGGRSVAVAGVVQDPLVYYMGGTGGGVWKTTNAGNTWSNISDKYFKTGSVGAVAVAPSDPNVVVVGMGESPFRGVASSHGDGVYVSTDAGRTWTHAGLENTRQISEVVIHPADPDIIWVAAQGSPWAATEDRGVYQSTDGGKNWEQVLFVDNNTGAVDLAIHPGNPRILFAAMWDHDREPWEIRSGGPGSGIYRSTDGGATWDEVTEGLPDTMGKIGIAPSGANPDLVWAIVEAKEKGGLYRSVDGGESWGHVNGDRRLHARSWYYMHVFADPKNEHVVHVLNAPFMTSIDGGKSFSGISTPHGDHHELWINPDNPANMINGNDGGATVTFDGGKTWTSEHNQPTAQFYRVNTDNQFNYRVYGGQQDNSTVSIPSRSDDGDVGGREDYFQVGGCESAYIDFDPDNPRYIYAGCYLGLISEHDSDTGAERDIRVYPELLFGVPPKQRKYRFNWNAPIVVSQHNPEVIYHAGNIVFKTTNRGQSWDAISPDLTQDTEDTQGPGGRPITNEVSENYNTILSLEESPHDASVLWAGTDDGRLQVTRDGGESWDDVTPRGIDDGMFNAIDISAHDPATAYVAYTRYKYNDHQPRIYKTSNYGQRWSDISDGIPEDTFVRVVREDTERQGLLFAGTETGVFVSFNDGDDWQALQNNLPVVPVTDIKVQRDDLVLSTQGRAFWILDNITPLRQMNTAGNDAELHLYAPQQAYLLRSGGGGDSVGSNPANGAVIDFVVAETDQSEEQQEEEQAPLKLELLDSDGQVIRTLATDQEGSNKLETKAGHNRVVWDLNSDHLNTVQNEFVIAAGRDKKITGPRVAPGNYTVRLSDGETSLEQPLSVQMDPRLTIAQTDIDEYEALKTELASALDELHGSIEAFRSVRDQATARKALLDEEENQELIEAIDAVVTATEKWENSVFTSEWEFFQDVLNWPSKLDFNLQSLLYFSVNGTLPPLTDGIQARADDVLTEWREAQAARDAVVENEISAFNTAFAAADQAGVVVPDFVAE